MKAFPSALFLALPLVLFSVLFLSGCGQKGPLFLPGQAPESQTDGPFGMNNDGDDAQSSTPEQSADQPGDGVDADQPQ